MGVVLRQECQDGARGARHHTFVFFFLVHGADVQRHAAGVFHGQSFDVFFGPDTAQEIILAFAERSGEEDEGSVDLFVDLRTHQ